MDPVANARLNLSRFGDQTRARVRGILRSGFRTALAACDESEFYRVLETPRDSRRAAFAFLVASSFSTGFIVSNIRFDETAQRFLNDKGVLYPLYLSYVLGGIVAACVTMLTKLRTLSKAQRTRTVLIVAAILVPTIA